MRTRFAPSPTGNVHIGNIRVAIFNWLAARHAGGEFLVRVEDTDLERSTPEAIEKMFNALKWLGIDYDSEPVYQTKERKNHEAAAKSFLASGFASSKGEGEPTYLRICKELFDESFITEPQDDAEINWEKGDLVADKETITHTVTSPKSGETYKTPVNWDALSEPVFIYEDGSEGDALAIFAQLTESEVALTEITGKRVVRLKFKRRYVYFDDLVLGRCQKPLDSLRNLVIVRSDGSPVFHIANVIDDLKQEITHILRGNDHVENTFRHLFIYKALGKTPPLYGHFPMIVNAKGKPYSKRDGDAYVGDFQSNGFLPDALFNFLALCGWSPGDDREMMSKDEMKEAFTLERVNASAAQFNMEKLEWLNQQYMQKMSDAELLPLLKNELATSGIDVSKIEDEWFSVLVGTQRERISKLSDFVTNTSYIFSGDFEFVPKAVKKNLTKNEGAGLANLKIIKEFLAGIESWEIENIDKQIHDFCEEKELQMGMVAQPIRVACTGNVVSPGIGETLYLIGKEEVLKRIDRVLSEITID